MNHLVNKSNYKTFHIGTKARNLFQLIEREELGIHVPNLFCIDSAELEPYLNRYHDELEEIINTIHFHDEESLESASQRFKKIVGSITFQQEFIEEVRNYIEQNFQEDTLFSVRSSSSVEDDMDSSFAGQFDTYLNVSRNHIFHEIKNCLGSLFSPNVLEYCHNKGFNISDLRMNIIIQEMIHSDASGIIFTANPRGLLNEMVIVVGEGTGNLVVEDKVMTTTYYYHASDQNYYYERQEDSYLITPSTFETMISMINNIKKVYGEFLDIEFAIWKDVIYILQVRPITTLRTDQTLIFDNSNIVESYPNITLPLTASFVKEAYYGVFHGLAKRVLSNDVLVNQYNSVLQEMVEDVNGRMYYNINNWYTVIKFLPMSKKIIPIWQEMLGVTDKQYNSEKIHIGIPQKMKTYLSVMRQFIKVPKEMDKLNESYLEVSDHFKQNYNQNLDNKNLIELYNGISEKVLNVWDITLLNDMYAFIFVGLIKHQLKKMKVTDYEAKANNYISGITNIESMKPVKALLSLTKKVVDEGRVDELQALKSNEMLLDYIAENQSDFIESFNQYIDCYGDRSLEELKLESKTFRVDPITLVEKIMEYAGDMGKLQNMLQSIQSDEENQLPSEVIKECNWFQKKILILLSKKAMLGIKHREISRMNRSRIYGMVRTIFLTIGDNFYQSKLIDEKQDIFYLKTTEVFEFIHGGTLDLKEIIRLRKQEYVMYHKLPNASRLIFMNELFHRKHNNINSEVMFEGGNEILGIPCSNGIVTGEVVVVEDPTTIKEFKDKILITKMTDPGWVFLITLAKGIIAEKGSLLSHTAIISRELNIPSIVGVKNITKILRSGDIITMNGNTGEIVIEKRR